MNKSESINELATALSLAQGEIENAPKSSENPHFKSKYADLAEVINCIRPVFSKHGLAFTQFVSYDAGIVSVETVLMHKGGQWLSGTISAPVSKQDAQGVGSTTTYCRRYSLAAVAGLAQEDDDANAAVGHGKSEGKKEAPAMTADREAINARIVSALRAYGCKTVREAELTVKQFSAMPASDKYPAREGVTDYHKLSDGQAKVLADKLEKAAKDKAAETPTVCADCGAPITGDKCEQCGPI